MTDAPVLDLDALFERPTVKFQGKEYELRTLQEFGIVSWHKFVQLDKAAVALAKRAATSADAAQRLSKKQREAAAMLFVGDLPTGISDAECAAVIRFWSSTVDSGVEGDDTNPPKPPKPRTGAGQSRGSKRSTAATRKRGSTSRSTR